MARVTLKRKDIEHLMKKYLPDISIVKWNKGNMVLEINFIKLNAKRDRWGNLVLYTFQNVKIPKKSKFMVKRQEVDGNKHFQLIIQ